jgi:hypothetical protein
MAAENAENVFDQIQPATVSADELHALLMSIKEENSTLRRQIADLQAVKVKEEQGTVGIAGGTPVVHHLHLVDGRVIQNYEGIGTHYSETDEHGNEKVTRIREHYPVEEVHPSKAYA